MNIGATIEILNDALITYNLEDGICVAVLVCGEFFHGLVNSIESDEEQMKYFTPAAVAVLALVLASCSPRKLQVELVLTNGNIETMDASLPRAEAVAVNNGKIVGVGTSEAVDSHFAGNATIDLHGAYVLPGLIDGHAHMLQLGLSLQTVNLSGTRSPQQVAKLVEEATASARLGGWIRGGGWNPGEWRESVSQVGGLLDNAAPDNFVFLVSSDGNAIWVNQKVLELAGINRATKSPVGGEIVRSRSGVPTGILVGSAIGLVTSKIPSPSEDEIKSAIEQAADTCARYGLTEVQDAGIGRQTLEAYKLLADQGRLKIRIYAMYDGNDTTLPRILRAGRIIDYKKRFTMRSVRVDMDGPLGPRQAALVRQYSDAPGQYGATLMGVKSLENLTIASLSSGFQVCTEAHGDRGINVVLDAYRKALAIAGVGDPRLRVEGADVPLGKDIPRFAELGVIPSVQPAVCTSDMYWVESRLGPGRTKLAYPWKSLLDHGSRIISGSDFPNESPDPRLGIHSAVTRKDVNGIPVSFSQARRYFQMTPDAAVDSSEFDGGFFPRQRMSLEQALKSFTVWPAYGAFEEKEKGSITVGKLADFTVLKDDLREIPPAQIPYDPVLATIVGGKFVYENPVAKTWSAK